MGDRLHSFAEFWVFYLREHAKSGTRALHLVGSTGALGFLVLAVVLHRPWFYLVAGLLGYGCAWIGHFFVEHNRPATFRYPLWSFVADWKMWACALTGRLGSELERAGVRR